MRSLTPRCSGQCILWLRAVLDNAFFDSAMFWTMCSLTLRCSEQCVLWLRAVLDNAFYDSALYWTMRSLTPRCSGQCVLWLRAVLDNAFFDSALFWAMHSLTLRCSGQCVLWLCAVLDNVFFDSALYWTMRSLIPRCSVQCVLWLWAVLRVVTHLLRDRGRISYQYFLVLWTLYKLIIVPSPYKSKTIQKLRLEWKSGLQAFLIETSESLTVAKLRSWQREKIYTFQLTAQRKTSRFQKVVRIMIDQSRARDKLKRQRQRNNLLWFLWHEN